MNPATPGETTPSPIASATARLLRQRIEGRAARPGLCWPPAGRGVARSGFPVTGIDPDPAKVEKLRVGESYIDDVPSGDLAPLVAQGRLRASSDFSLLAEVDTVNICVPTPLRKTKDPDLSYILSAIDEL